MWKLKVFIQFILAHIPFGEKINHILQCLRNNRRKRIKEIQNQIYEVCESLKILSEFIDFKGATVVEVGTGWCPLPTTLIALLGINSIYTYDHIRHVRFNLIREMLGVLSRNTYFIAEEFDIPEGQINERLNTLRKAQNLEEFFEYAKICYMAPGDASNTSLPGSSVDIFFSYAVLEHIPELVVRELVKEAGRVLKHSGCFYALIGLHDHYSSFDRSISKVNFLKYPEWLWSFFVKNNISYHNRMREKEYINIIEEEKGIIRKILSRTDYMDIQECRMMRLDTRFRKFTPEECAVTRSEIISSFMKN